MMILTTRAGVFLPESVQVEQFPLLVRLVGDTFDFRQAHPNGNDLRFVSESGELLAYEIEQWNPQAGEAALWVRIPKIQGNRKQAIRMFWGNPNAAAESKSGEVFRRQDGYLSVFHFGADLADSVGTLALRNVGTRDAAGRVGNGRLCAEGAGLALTQPTSMLPSGAESSSTEVWMKADRPNGTLVGWGNEQAQGKVVMQYRSPPHIRMDCYFSRGDVRSVGDFPTGDWVHVVHTYDQGASRLFINGELAGENLKNGGPLAVRRPARLWIGGWYDRFDFVGSMDEVRVSSVARSPEWIRLQYENQRANQRLVGTLIQPGDTWSGLPAKLSIPEGSKQEIAVQAGGAEKLTWTLLRDGRETILATDRLRMTVEAGRFVGDQSGTLRLTAVYPDAVRVSESTLTFTEAIPEPQFTLSAPKQWNGRTPIAIVPQVTNLDRLRAANADTVRMRWTVRDFATIREVQPDRLILRRAMNHGTLVVTASLENGGTEIQQSVEIAVTEPAMDPWIHRTPQNEEIPQEGQFFARDHYNQGTLHYRGKVSDVDTPVFLRVFSDDRPFFSAKQKPQPDGWYAFAVILQPGLVKYRVEFGRSKPGGDEVTNRVGNLQCGDAFLIQGQSNAVATDFGKDDPDFRSDWIRTFGSMSGNRDAKPTWGNAVHRSRDGGTHQIGYWGMELGRRLVEANQVPVCFLNGAVGGTRIDQHQRNSTKPDDPETIYGRLLWRVREAKLTHGIKAIFWHQGENDQSADGPTGGYGFETYRSLFIDLAASWKRDYPNLQRMFAFQIWPRACAMGVNGSDNRLREVQRNLPSAFSNLAIMSTLGIDPPGGCHYPAAGYAEMARLIFPLVQRDCYGVIPDHSITPANLRSVTRNATDPSRLVLEFDQPVVWDDAVMGNFQVDGDAKRIRAGKAIGNRLELELRSPMASGTVSYLDGAAWNPKQVLRGKNGIAALTFWEVPIRPMSR
ncbi:DUF2341 domain-containing protein [Tuwongella immobilis]|nr:DUF2341 domain-containing protein [Tuwongella immobilis]